MTLSEEDDKNLLSVIVMIDHDAGAMTTAMLSI